MSVSPPFKGNGPLMNLLGLSPVLAILVGVRLHRPAARRAVACFALGFALFWLGDLYTYSYPRSSARGAVPVDRRRRSTSSSTRC